MSRSKRAPYHTQGYKGDARKKSKREAAKAVRNQPDDEAPKSGSAFKREYNSWDICDWKFYSPLDKKVRRK